MSVFENEASLPVQPVPMLNVTSEFIRKQMEPYCREEDREAADAAATALKAQGQPYQQALREFAESRGGNASWLRPLLDDGLLAARNPLPFFSNRVVEVRTERWPSPSLPAFVVAACTFLQRLGRGDLPPETGPDGPLAMDCLRTLAATRIPCPSTDLLSACPLTGPARVAVVHEGHWFLLTLSDASGALVSPGAVAKALHSIRRLAPDLPREAAIGAVTAADRDNAAELRGRLLSHLENRVNLSAIECSLFVVALSGSNFGGNVLHDFLAGDAANRYFNKSFQVLEGPSDRLGLNIEGAAGEVGLWAYALETMDGWIREPGFGAAGGNEGVTIRHLPFYVDAGLGADIRACRQRHALAADALRVTAADIAGIPPETLAAGKCDIETVAELAFICVFYQLAGEFPAVLRETPARRHCQGRTEVLRPASPQALAFARALAGDEEPSRLRELLAAAAKEYALRAERCRDGMGPDTHILGLRAMAEILKNSRKDLLPPDLLSSPAWLASTRATLKTAALFSPGVDYVAFAPAEADGLGLGYTTFEDDLAVTVTARTESRVDMERFTDALNRTLGKIADLLEDAE